MLQAAHSVTQKNLFMLDSTPRTYSAVVVVLDVMAKHAGVFLYHRIQFISIYGSLSCLPSSVCVANLRIRSVAGAHNHLT